MTPSYGAGGGSAATFSVGNAISYGWNAFWKNVGPMVLIALAIFIVNLILAFIAGAARNIVLYIIFEIIAWVVGMILALGFIRAALDVTAGRTPDLGELTKTEGVANYVVAAILFGIGAAIGFLLCIVPGILFVIAFGFFGFVIVDGAGDLGPTEALSRASEIARGHWGELFLLYLALVGINIIGAILCGIGLLFTYGITAIAVAYAYRTLTGQAVAPAN